MGLINTTFLLWLAHFLSLALTRTGGGLRMRDSSPTPISVPSSQSFDGDDGPWSSFTIQVGTPPQTLQVFVSTAISATWVIISAGCPASDSTCPSDRGGIYYNASSSTWVQQGDFLLSAEENLNITAAGLFGNDTVTLGIQGNGGTVLQNQLVAGIAAEQFWLGMLGLNPSASNLSTTDLGQPSFMTTLRQQNLIPSLSYGYTAGNQYSLKTVTGSLTLGGYDSARFAPNDVSFDVSNEDSRDLVVGIQSVQYTDAKGQIVDLLGSNVGIQAAIDSTVAELWLPTSSCALFEKVFGLVYDPVNKLYPVNSSTHTALKALNPNITIALGNTTSSAPIVLPYAAFDLSAKWPKYPNNTLYFPLQRAESPSQYTLGRTLLQEAYLTVDYERSNFSISQAIFPEGLGSDIVPITPPTNPTIPSKAPSVSSPSSSSNKTIGIAVGVALGVFLVVAVVAGALIFRRRRRSQSPANHPPSRSHSRSSSFAVFRRRKSSLMSQPLSTHGSPLKMFHRKKSSDVTHIDQTFEKTELNTGLEHSRFEVPGSEPGPRQQISEATTLLPPPPAFTDQERLSDIRSPSPLPPELIGDEGHPPAELQSAMPDTYASTLSIFHPIELPASIQNNSSPNSPLEIDSPTLGMQIDALPSSSNPTRNRSQRNSTVRPELHKRHSTLDSMPSELDTEMDGRDDGIALLSPISPIDRGSWGGL